MTVALHPDDGPNAYAEAIAHLQHLQLAAGEMLAASLATGDHAPLDLAHTFAREANRLREQVAAWLEARKPAAMPAASVVRQLSRTGGR